MANGIFKHHPAIQYSPDKWLSTIIPMKKTLDASLMHGRRALAEFYSFQAKNAFVQMYCLLFPVLGKCFILVFLYKDMKKNNKLTFQDKKKE